jgi:hypothetical protein
MGESHGGNFRLIGRFCAEHKVRVVNLSWGDEPQEFEEWLARSKANQPGEERKQEALELYSIWKQAIVEAIQGCAKYALRRCCWKCRQRRWIPGRRALCTGTSQPHYGWGDQSSRRCDQLHQSRQNGGRKATAKGQQ